jgi:hypothetical protein
MRTPKIANPGLNVSVQHETLLTASYRAIVELRESILGLKMKPKESYQLVDRPPYQYRRDI